MTLLWVCGAASAGEFALHGAAKTFVVTSVPYAWFTEPELPPSVPEGALLDAAGLGSDPTISGIADFRLTGELSAGLWEAQVHEALTLLPAASTTGFGGTSAGVGLGAPELVDLTWQPDTGDELALRARTDRLWVSFSPPHLTVTVGRQPISFGTGLVFTPLDVVNPFSPATIDTEYKPGVDALRADVYAGTATRLTAVVAWAGARPPTAEAAGPVGADDLILTANGGATVGVTDVQLQVGLVRGELVAGAGVASSVGPLGVHADATITLPEEGDPFVRAVVGGEGRPTTRTTIALEGYVQTFGAGSPDGYLAAAADPRFARGEVWLLGRGYGALTVAQELTPLVSVSAALIANLVDPSALFAPGLAWSVSDEAVVAIGGYLAAGARPDPIPLELDPATLSIVPPSEQALAASVNSEFGLYPHALFVQMKAYF